MRVCVWYICVCGVGCVCGIYVYVVWCVCVRGIYACVCVVYMCMCMWCGGCVWYIRVCGVGCVCGMCGTCCGVRCVFFTRTHHHTDPKPSHPAGRRGQKASLPVSVTADHREPGINSPVPSSPEPGRQGPALSATPGKLRVRPPRWASGQPGLHPPQPCSLPACLFASPFSTSFL